MESIFVEKALKLKEEGVIKLGISCREIFHEDKEYDIFCPYRESNCEGKICPKYLAYLDSKDDKVIKEELSNMGLNFEDKNHFKTLMSMQANFESRFHSLDNLTKEDKDHWINVYLVCIEDEIRETREHLNIYPDRVVMTNVQEMKKEIIDILHFMMDEFICGGANYKDIEEAYLKEYSKDTKVDNLISYSYELQKDSLFDLYKNESYDQTCLLLVNKLLDCSAQVRQCISWKHWKKPSSEIDDKKLYSAFAKTFKVFMDLCIYNNMTPEDIKNIYINKNVENIRRQKYGY